MTQRASKITLFDDPHNQPGDQEMEFRLTYDGPLFSTQNEPCGSQKDSKADHKHTLRKRFHTQLKRLWEITPFLHNPRGIAQIRTRRTMEEYEQPHDIQTLSEKFNIPPFNFVPLVTHDIELFCGLNILFLRPDKPGKLWRGDIDNRIKTLIDALQVPEINEGYAQRIPEAGEAPFFCLLAKDELVTKLSIETDQLLEFVTQEQSLNDVRLVITVRIWPYAMHIGNMEFGSG
jgi:hypothetical protein